MAATAFTPHLLSRSRGASPQRVQPYAGSRLPADVSAQADAAALRRIGIVLAAAAAAVTMLAFMAVVTN